MGTDQLDNGMQRIDRCESTDPKRPIRCTRPAGHDTHSNGRHTWPAPAAELTEEQRLAEQVIRSAATDLGRIYIRRALADQGIAPERIDAVIGDVARAVASAQVSVAVSWPADTTEASR